MANEFDEQRKQARQRFFVMLQAAQSNANLFEEEAEQLAVEAVKAVRANKDHKRDS